MQAENRTHSFKIPLRVRKLRTIEGNPANLSSRTVELPQLEKVCRSQWSRGLRRRSAAARLLRLWVRIPPEHGYLSVVNVVPCQVEVTATSCSLVQRSPTDCGATLCVIQNPRECGRPGQLGAVAPKTSTQTQSLVSISRPNYGNTLQVRLVV